MEEKFAFEYLAASGQISGRYKVVYIKNGKACLVMINENNDECGKKITRKIKNIAGSEFLKISKSRYACIL